MPNLRRFTPRCFRANRRRCVVIAGIFVLGYFFFLPTTRDSSDSWITNDLASLNRPGGRKVLQVTGNNTSNDVNTPLTTTSTTTKDTNSDTSKTKGNQTTTEKSGSIYPEDIFTEQQRERGAIILHVMGVLYMFLALAIVCDEFFVPALGVITEKLQISEDVAGATFMAAGGSAPELFTSLIGTFFSKNDVGIGTIVGSAVFNILFVIGMCSFASLTLLTLTWWPLFRDVCFYSVSLMFLIIFFQDSEIEVYESFILFVCYLCYVVFMKFNERIEAKVFSCLEYCCPSRYQSAADAATTPKRKLSREASIVFLGPGSLQYRQRKSIAQLLFNDPTSEENITARRKSTHESASGQGEYLDKGNHNDHPNRMQIKESSTRSSEKPVPESHSDIGSQDARSQATSEMEKTGDGRKDTTMSDSISEVANGLQLLDSDEKSRSDEKEDAKSAVIDIQEEYKKEHLSEDIDEETPLDMTFPEGTWERIVYMTILPITGPLWLTLADVRRDSSKKWFVITFVGSIFWIGIFSFCMVWWANTIGLTVGVSAEIMGITLLAAGTSVPDLITSVIVAKKGFGDMAVSSSVGSNIFDITVGLPVPWLLQAAATGGESYAVTSDGLFCSIILLFGMLIAVIISIAVSDWKMKKSLGLAMMFLYLIFVVVAIMLTQGVIDCDNLTSKIAL